MTCKYEMLWKIQKRWLERELTKYIPIKDDPDMRPYIATLTVVVDKMYEIEKLKDWQIQALNANIDNETDNMYGREETTIHRM